MLMGLAEPKHFSSDLKVQCVFQIKCMRPISLERAVVNQAHLTPPLTPILTIRMNPEKVEGELLEPEEAAAVSMEVAIA